MKIPAHNASQYADAIKALLPPGEAWNWPEGGLGASMLLGTAEELVRLDAAAQNALDFAIDLHRPKSASWNIREYRRIAREALGALAETMPRKTFAVGARVGDRVWSAAAPDSTFPVPLVQVDHLLRPLRVGSRVGDRLWGNYSRYVIRVAYYRSVVNPDVLFAALNAFKQAHVYLSFVDITGVGGEVIYGQN